MKTLPTEPAADAPVPQAGTELPAGRDGVQPQDHAQMARPQETKPEEPKTDEQSGVLEAVADVVGDVVVGVVVAIFDN